jgi:hypothetical protein
MGDDYSVRLLRRLTHTPLALKDTLGDKLYDAYISSMLTPFSIDEVRLMERKTLYQVSTKCGDDKTFYRFGFNGQEKDNELKGKGNVNTAEFWEYDTRFGRRWNIDPVDQIGISNYACFANNPIFLVDIKGDEVRNGDKIASEKYKEKADDLIKNLEKYENQHRIKKGMNKKDFYKLGLDKKAWNGYNRIQEKIQTYRKKSEYHEKQAEVTEKIIKEWKVNSPSLYDKVDKVESSVNKENVDFIIFTGEEKIVGGEIILGNNAPSYQGDLELPILVADREQIGEVNAVSIFIKENVSLSQPENTVHGLQYLLNHEAGHFMYIVRNTSKYLKYRTELQKNGISNNGGHHKDDESGVEAINLGKNKDINIE